MIRRPPSAPILRRLLVGLFAALLLTVGVAAPAAAKGNDSPTNDAVAVNTKDGSSVFKLAFSVRSIESSVVAPENAAVAYASCTNCQTIAIAVQVVFVIGSPDVFTPENVAIAINENCSFCDTLATAYQFVVQSSVPVRLTHDGKRQLHDIFKALQDLDGSGLTALEIQAKVDELMQQLAQVLATEVEPIPGKNDEGRDGPSTTASTTTTTTVTTSTSTSTSTSTTTTVSTSTSSSSSSS